MTTRSSLAELLADPGSSAPAIISTSPLVVVSALASGKPALINCVIDPTAGTESGHLQNLNPHTQVGNRKGA